MDVYNNIEKYFMIGSKRGPEDSKLKSIDESLILGFHRLAINGLIVNLINLLKYQIPQVSPTVKSIITTSYQKHSSLI